MTYREAIVWYRTRSDEEIRRAIESDKRTIEEAGYCDNYTDAARARISLAACEQILRDRAAGKVSTAG